MKPVTKSRYVNITLHVLIWGVLLLLPYFVSTAANGYAIGLIPGLFFTVAGLIHMGIFYGNAYFLYPVFFNRRFWWLYLLLSALLIYASLQLKYHILDTWFPFVLKTPSVYKFVFGPSIAFFIISIIYRKVIDQVSFEKEQKEKQAAQLLTELKFLRSQISPHFLFNVLTNLVSLARKKSDKLEQSLIMLSDLMRYMLYDTRGNKIALQKEIEYLNNYIALQKLRFGNDVPVNSSIEAGDENNGYSIEPMLLIPFVENAFKHGTGYHEQPAIDIALSVNRERLFFEVKNTFENEPAGSGENPGIGLNNVRSRLNLLYKDNYTLTLDDRNNVFHIVLTLKLI